ncbi:MAG: cation diffusion facilitator family transporter [Thermovirgaceae bacterium]
MRRLISVRRYRQEESETSNKTGDHRSKKALRVSWVGLVSNAALMVLKFAGGILGNSAAVTADAVNSLSDFATDIVAVAAFRMTGKPVDATHDYGHGKFETLSSLVIGVFLVAAALGIFWGGLSRIMVICRGNTIPEPGMIALAAAGITIFWKEVLYRYTQKAAKGLESDALMAKAWDHRSDALASSGTFAAITGAVFFGERARILDPIAALAVGVLILRIALPVIKRSVGELSEASLPEETERKLLAAILAVPGIISAHHLRTRRIGPSVAVDVHVIVKASLSVKEGHDIATAAEEAIRRLHGDDAFVSVHVEPQTDSGGRPGPGIGEGQNGMEESSSLH